MPNTVPTVPILSTTGERGGGGGGAVFQCGGIGTGVGMCRCVGCRCGRAGGGRAVDRRGEGVGGLEGHAGGEGGRCVYVCRDSLSRGVRGGE